MLSRPLFARPADPAPSQGLEGLVDRLLEELDSRDDSLTRCSARLVGPLWMLKDLCYCEDWMFEPSAMIDAGVTHVFCEAAAIDRVTRFTYLALRNPRKPEEAPVRVAARLSDFMKETVFYRGKMAVIGSSRVMLPSLLYALALRFQTSAF